MICSICNRAFDKSDLAAGTCQECFDVIDQTQIQELRNHLNLDAYKPPEISVPANKEAPILPPESEQCPFCYADLMGDDLVRWKSDCICAFCGERNPSPIMPIPKHPQVNDEDTLVLEEGDLSLRNSVASIDESHPKCNFILNSGSSIGKVISLPVNIDMGRREIRQTISDPTYGDILSKISSEHIKIHLDENGAISIEDLGSLNGTFINGNKIVGPIPTQLNEMDALNLHDLSLVLKPESRPLLHVRHNQSLVSLCKVVENLPSTIHLGRETREQNRESWFRMAELQLANEPVKIDVMQYISRRHLFLEFKHNDTPDISIRIWHEDGKEACEVLLPQQNSVKKSAVMSASEEQLLSLSDTVEIKFHENDFTVWFEE